MKKFKKANDSFSINCFVSIIQQMDEEHSKERHIRELFERQIIELNEIVQILENDKNELNNEIDELKQQLQSKEKQSQTSEVNKIDLSY